MDKVNYIAYYIYIVVVKQKLRGKITKPLYMNIHNIIYCSWTERPTDKCQIDIGNDPKNSGLSLIGENYVTDGHTRIIE